MGEIVRVLKWRLDLDAAGLATGLDSATTKAKAFGDEAERSGSRASTGLGKTRDGAKGAGEGLDTASIAARNLDTVLGRLEKGSASPLVLERNAQQAAAALKVMEAEAASAGTTIDQALRDRAGKAIQDATTFAKAMNAEFEQMGGQTPTKLDKVITALEKTQTSLAGMGESGRAAAAALADLEKAGDSPERLQKSATSASLALSKVKDELKAAASEGKRFGPEVAASVSQAEQAITAAATKSAELRDRQADLTKQGNIAAKGAEQLGQQFNSVGGIMDALKVSGGELGAKLADVGAKAGAVTAAFTTGYVVGQKFMEGLKSIGIPADQAADKLLNVGRAALGMKSALETSGSLFSALPGPINASLRALQAHEKATDDAAASLNKLGISWRQASDETRTFNEAVGQIDKYLGEAKKSGEDFEATIKLNASSLAEMAAKATELGIPLASLPPAVQEAVAAAERLTEAASATAGALGAIGEGAAGVTDALGGMTDAEIAAADATAAMQAQIDESAAAYDAQAQRVQGARKNTNEASAATQQFMETSRRALSGSAESWGRIEQEVQRANEAGEQINATMELIQFTIRQAAEASVEYVYQISESLRKLAEDAPASAERVSNALGLLAEAARGGVGDLAAWNTQWATYYAQIEKLLALNMGTIFEAELRQMVAAFEELRKSVNSGETKPEETMRI